MYFPPVLRLVMLVFGITLALPASAETQSDAFSAESALRDSQSVIGKAIGNYRFTDYNGEKVQLSDFLGRPMVINFIYTSCAYGCPLITQTLSDAAELAYEALDQDSFTVLTIGFDTAEDTPERMKTFARQQGIDNDGWRFLSSDFPTVVSLSEELGFVFFRSAKGFDHLAQVTIVDQQGKIYRQVYGDNFELPYLVEPLKELVFGTPAPFSSVSDLVKKVRLFCTIYDPKADRYRFDYSIFIQFFVGTLVVGSMFIYVLRQWWRLWRRSRRSRRESPPHPSST